MLGQIVIKFLRMEASFSFTQITCVGDVVIRLLPPADGLEEDLVRIGVLKGTEIAALQFQKR